MTGSPPARGPASGGDGVRGVRAGEDAALQHHLRAAAQHEGVHVAGVEGVEHGRGVQPHVIRRERAGGHLVRRVGHHRALRVHHPLGPPRRAARVHLRERETHTYHVQSRKRGAWVC